MATTHPPCQSGRSPGTRVLLPSHDRFPHPALAAPSDAERHAMLLTFTGRRTGKTYTIPVGYTREGGTLTLFTDHAWWRNLRGDGGVPVTVRLAGHPVAGRAEAIPDPAVVAHIAAGLVTRFGARGRKPEGPRARGRDEPCQMSSLRAAGQCVVRSPSSLRRANA